MKKPWTLGGWTQKQVQQQPTYPNQEAYQQVLTHINRLPPLVFPGEVQRLKSHIAGAARGDRFILQGGDCVERFIDCNAHTLTDKLKILLQMSVILTHALHKPVLRIGRIAGQFSKPRSEETELVGNQVLPTYRGDSINGFEPIPEQRRPDPQRLIQSYFHATATLNYLRSMINGGFADLHHPFSWNLDSFEKTDKWPEYEQIVERIIDAIHFMETFGGVNSERLGQIEFYTSHEALHLGFEQSLTRLDPVSGDHYNLGAHMLWIGERTRQIDGAHVEYMRGLANPLGVKISAAISVEELLKIIETLNPENESGKITLITRMGRDTVNAVLPELIEGVQESGFDVAWICDPMHGNTILSGDGLKTRRFADILMELEQTFTLHQSRGSQLSGVHFELTGDNVTECTGGAVDLQDNDLNRNYQSYCDPRLNYSQSMEMAFLLSRLINQ